MTPWTEGEARTDIANLVSLHRKGYYTVLEIVKALRGRSTWGDHHARFATEALAQIDIPGGES